MSIIIFSLFVFIIQIAILSKATKNNNKNYWSLLLSTSLLSIILLALFLLYSWININYIDWNFVGYLIISIVAISIYTLLLIISIILKTKIAKKKIKPELTENKNEQNLTRKTILKSLLIIFISYLLAVFIEFLPYRIKQKNDMIAENKAREQIIILLNQRYGNGNFEIEEMTRKNICDGCSWMGPGIDGYEFSISTDYLPNNFTVSLTKENFKIYENNFLNEYYKEKHGIPQLEDYLIKYKIHKLSEIVSHKFNAEIDFNNTFININLDKNYGHIPSIEELSNYVELQDPKFVIKDEIKTNDELLKYLLKLTKFYLTEFDTSNITYLQTNKYFRYKYDCTKLLDSNKTNQYNDYEGYVLAGNYIYSKEQERYIVIDEDTIVSINVMDDITTLTIEDILKVN